MLIPCADILGYSLCVYTHTNICRSTNWINLQFASAGKVANKDEIWCDTLGQFTSLDFPDLNPNTYDIKNMKFGLNVYTKVNFFANDQGLLFKNQDN